MEKLLVPSYVVEVEGFFVNHRAMPQIIHMSRYIVVWVLHGHSCTTNVKCHHELLLWLSLSKKDFC